MKFKALEKSASYSKSPKVAGGMIEARIRKPRRRLGGGVVIAQRVGEPDQKNTARRAALRVLRA